MADHQDTYGMTSPGGFMFGVQGWTWGEPRPRSITFFLDNTARVSDQHGRPIRGSVIDNKEFRFAAGPPPNDMIPGSRNHLATHAQVIAALAADRIDWLKLSRAGWPQLTYDELKKLPELPPTPLEELKKIKDPALRKDALRIRREYDAKLKEEVPVEVE